MNLVPPVPAALAGMALLLLPGLVLLSLLPRRDKEALPPDEALYLAMATSVAGSAWLGLLLAELGAFSLLRAAAVLAAVSVLAALLGRRHLSWPLRRPGSLRELAPAGLILALAITLQARPSEHIVSGREAGAQVAGMGIIARTGGLVFSDPAIRSLAPEHAGLFFPEPDGPPLSWTRFPGFDLESPRTGRVFSRSFHLFACCGAYLFQALGLSGALATPALLGILSSLGVFFAVRRLFGAPTALLAGLLLNLNVLQVWFGRHPSSAVLSQLLVFLGLLAFWHWEERRSAAFGALAGSALGLSLLVRLDGALLVIPLAVFLLLRTRGALRWSAALPLVVPFLLLGTHAAICGRLFAPTYLRAASIGCAAQDFLRLGWMLTPVGLGLGLAGLLSAILSRQPRLLFPLLSAVALSGICSCEPPPATGDYPWAFGRFIPVAVPLVLALASAFLVRLAGGGRLRRALATLLVVGLLGIYARDTRSILRHVDWRGAVELTADVARGIGPGNIVIFEGPAADYPLGLALWAAHGIGVLELADADPDPERLRHLVRSWRAASRNVYFVHSHAPGLGELFLQRVGDARAFWTREWSARDAPPGLPELRSLRFTLSRVVPPGELQVPPLPEVDIGGSDDFQVSGFFGKEGDRELSYRWTGSRALVYLPGARGGRAVALTASKGQRPAAAAVSVSLAGIRLGVMDVESPWQRYTLPLPDELPSRPLVLRLDLPPWRPADVEPGSRDERELGIMLDRVEVVGQN